MTIHLNLSADEVLSTTRSVRKRLDLTRPVERSVLEECLRLAQQAPSGSNIQNWHFVVVTDRATRAAVGEYVRRGADRYAEFAAQLAPDPARERTAESVRYLGKHIAEVPVHVIPCLEGRIDGAPAAQQAGTWACLIPAVWSFMLAARDRGLGRVDRLPPDLGEGGRGHRRHPLRHCHAGRADPGRLHDRHRLQAGPPAAPRHPDPLGPLVTHFPAPLG